MSNDKADEVIEKLFQSLLPRYQIGLKTLQQGNELVFYCADLFYYKCHKINPNEDWSYIYSPDLIKNKKATIKPINKFFQYAETIVLNYEKIKKNLQIITKIKPCTDKYNWEGINYQSEKDNWKKWEKNNLKTRKYILPTFQDIAHFVKNKLIFQLFQKEKGGIILQ